MNLSFNNLSELDEFLQWATNYGASQTLVLKLDTSAPDTPLPTIDPSALPEAGAAGGVAFDTPPGRVNRSGDSAGEPTEAPATNEPTKRKRRTKAEIEADETAAALKAKAENDAKVEQDPASVTTSPTGANPFEQAVTITGQTDVQVEESALTGEPDADATVVTPFQHITRARAFIAKHQIAKYNETFAKAGTDPNVMAYTAEQRAAHMAAMDELDKA